MKPWIWDGVVVVRSAAWGFAAFALGALVSGELRAQTGEFPSTVVLLETIVVGGDGGGLNPPSFEAQKDRFLRRAGAETVVSVTAQDPGKQGSVSDLLTRTPGVYLTENGGQTGGFVSMRGSDIAVEGSRNGRGIRAYIDGIPLGRTDAGFTGALIDTGATDYIEVYRGGSSLRYGSIATGGALNFVSKTGRSAPGTRASIDIGSYGFVQGRLEHGMFNDNYDLYLQATGLRYGGFQPRTDENNIRFSANFGWRPNENVESRTFVSAGKTLQNLASRVPLDQLPTMRRSAPPLSVAGVGTFPYFEQDLNFNYQRIANRTTIRDGDTTYELGAYFVNTALDHMPVPFAGIIDNAWRDIGVSGRIEHRTQIAGLPTELVGGIRVGHTAGDFERYRHLNLGAGKGDKLYDWNFSSWLIESYGEAAIEILPRVKLFTGLQGVHTTRRLDDQYTGGAVVALRPVIPPPPPPVRLRPGGPQPGRFAGRQDYGREFQAFNPKLGVNWEYATTHFLFANVSRSYEVPSGADLSDVLAYNANPANVAKVGDLKAQSAWTWEAGIRGGSHRFEYDVTFYHMRLRDEIMSRCADALCGTTIAFNIPQTIHNGIEAAVKTVPVMDLFTPGDSIFVNGVWNFTDFRFDGDPRFGNHSLPVIPAHQVFAEAGYRHASGFYVSGNIRHLSKRLATYDGSGGSNFVIPAYTLLGARIGYKDPDDRWSAYIEGRNLTDEVYASEFSAIPTATGTSPLVRPGEGRAVYAGASLKF